MDYDPTCILTPYDKKLGHTKIPNGSIQIEIRKWLHFMANIFAKQPNCLNQDLPKFQQYIK
jgi:hypothetical protein